MNMIVSFILRVFILNWMSIVGIAPPLINGAQK